MYQNTKIQSMHLQRKAIIYIRQSSVQQVQNHQESQKRQYDLKNRAVMLGWHESNVLMIDEDLGISGAYSENRPGYQKLISMLALQQVGIILGIEVSRLARNCLDWYQLLELSSAFNTLIADEDAVFDPSDFNDRLLLGLKGTISEVELYQIKARMIRGRINKARRGDLEMTLPIGYERDIAGKICKSTNQEVRFAIAQLFELFKKLRSVRGVLLELKRRNQELPYWEKITGLETRIAWRKPAYDVIYAIVQNPTYAGVYIYGRRKTKYDPVTKKRKSTTVGKESIEVFIPDHHESYISKEEYEENIKNLRNNQYLGLNSQGAPREGYALLQGVVFCSKCGLKMRPRYTSNRYYYCCDRDHRRYGEPVCGWASALRVDSVVEGLMFDILNEGTIDLSFQLAQHYKKEKEVIQTQQEQKIKRLDYESNLARRRYESVDPENRLVASTLEAEWNKKLTDLEEAKTEFRCAYTEQNNSNISISEIKNILKFLPEDWYSKKFSIQDKKAIIRCIIERVFINTQGKILKVKVSWYGGNITELEVPKYIFTNSNIYHKIVDLARERTDSEIAIILNEENISTVKGRSWNTRRVMDFRLSNNIPSGFTTASGFKESVGYVTSSEIGIQLGVDKTTVQKWFKIGILHGRGRISKQGMLWIYWNEEVKKRLDGTASFDSTVKTFRSIMKTTGMTQQEVIKWANDNDNEIIRLRRGKTLHFFIRPYKSQVSNIR
jgi:DNA invertase Pin-like site-specific DNA recombinase